jgi:hypothetical protein
MNAGDVARAAMLELESAQLAVKRAASGEPDMVERVVAHALVSIAASLMRLAGAPARPPLDREHDTVTRNVAALANSVLNLSARVDRLEDAQPAPDPLDVEPGRD